MPDIQTEIFTKVLPNLANLKFDDPDEQEETPMTTTADEIPLTRQIFEYIKLHPKCHGKDIMTVFAAAGHKRPVISATTTYLITSKRVERLATMRLLAIRNNYDKPKVTKVTAQPEKAATVATPAFVDTAKIIEGLTIMQGKELYDRLKAIYGG